MIPVVAGLMKFGLGLLGQAVITKGKEAIEQKFGVDIGDMLGSEVGRVELVKLQAQNEQALQALAIQAREVDLKSEAMAYADTASARDMNARVNESANAGWLPKNIAALISVVVVCGGLAIIAWSPEESVRLAAVSLVTIVLTFYFGSSSSSRSKDSTIAKMANDLGQQP